AISDEMVVRINLRGRCETGSRSAQEGEQPRGLTPSVNGETERQKTPSSNTRCRLTRCVGADRSLSRLTTPSANLHGGFYLLAADRSQGIDAERAERGQQRAADRHHRRQ